MRLRALDILQPTKILKKKKKTSMKYIDIKKQGITLQYK